MCSKNVERKKRRTTRYPHPHPLDEEGTQRNKPNPFARVKSCCHVRVGLGRDGMGLCVSLAHCPNVDLLCGSYGSQLTGGLKRMIKRRASVCVCQCQSLVTIGETAVLATASCHCASGSCMIMCARLALGTTTSSLGLVSSSGLPEVGYI